MRHLKRHRQEVTGEDLFVGIDLHKARWHVIFSQGGSDESTTYCGAFSDLTFQIGSSYLVVL